MNGLKTLKVPLNRLISSTTDTGPGDLKSAKLIYSELNQERIFSVRLNCLAHRMDGDTKVILLTQETLTDLVTSLVHTLHTRTNLMHLQAVTEALGLLPVMTFSNNVVDSRWNTYVQFFRLVIILLQRENGGGILGALVGLNPDIDAKIPELLSLCMELEKNFDNIFDVLMVLILFSKMN